MSRYTLWVKAHTKKVRSFPNGRHFHPSTAELRRWLHDHATPRAERCVIYDKLLYRRHHQ